MLQVDVVTLDGELLGRFGVALDAMNLHERVLQVARKKGLLLRDVLVRFSDPVDTPEPELLPTVVTLPSGVVSVTPSDGNAPFLIQVQGSHLVTVEFDGFTQTYNYHLVLSTIKMYQKGLAEKGHAIGQRFLADRLVVMEQALALMEALRDPPTPGVDDDDEELQDPF